MTDSYKVGYSVDALDDLREIYSYIANELLAPETATSQLGRIRIFFQLLTAADIWKQWGLRRPLFSFTICLLTFCVTIFCPAGD